MQISGTVSSVNFFKSGKSAKGDWTMYKVIVNGIEYTTFEADLQVGQTGTFDIKEEQRTSNNGRSYTARTLSRTKTQQQPSANPPASPANSAVVEINRKLDEILRLLRPKASFESSFSEPQPPMSQDIDVSDIPF